MSDTTDELRFALARSPIPSDGWPDRPAAVLDRAKTRTQAEIEAEKAAKPRPDLLPAKALSMVVHGHGVFALLGDYFKTKEPDDLGPVLGAILDECIEADIAKTRAEVLLLVGEIMGVGLRKHGPCTWRVAGTEQADPQTHYASAVRHMLEHCAGIKADPDSGRHPLLHAVCQIAIMINLLDDPPTDMGKNDGRAMIGAVR